MGAPAPRPGPGRRGCASSSQKQSQPQGPRRRAPGWGTPKGRRPRTPASRHPHESLSRRPVFPESPRMPLEAGGRSHRCCRPGSAGSGARPAAPAPPAGRVSGPGPVAEGAEPTSLSLCLGVDFLCSDPGVSGGADLLLRSREPPLTHDPATSSPDPTQHPAPRAMSLPETSGNSCSPCGLPPSCTAHRASQRARSLGTPVATSGLSLRPAHA